MITTSLTITEADRDFCKEKQINISQFLRDRLREFKDRLENPDLHGESNIELSRRLLVMSKIIEKHNQFLESQGLTHAFLRESDL